MSTSAVSTCVPVGTIFQSSWGYDQTNVEYWEVVRATAKTVWVSEIYQTRDSENRCLPRPGAFKAPLKPEAHRLTPSGAIRLEAWGKYAFKWDGKSVADTDTYGGAGH